MSDGSSLSCYLEYTGNGIFHRSREYTTVHDRTCTHGRRGLYWQILNSKSSRSCFRRSIGGTGKLRFLPKNYLKRSICQNLKTIPLTKPCHEPIRPITTGRMTYRNLRLRFPALWIPGILLGILRRIQMTRLSIFASRLNRGSRTLTKAITALA